MRKASLAAAAVTRHFASVLLFALLLATMACSVARDQDDQSATTGGALAAATANPESPAPYVIQAGDQIEVAVWKNAELSRTVLVRPDGRISLPLLNEVSAAGLTAAELRTQLAEKLAEYVSAGEVSVIIHQVKDAAISVIGEVQQPGRFALQSRTTVLDALAMAGGLTEFASDSTITVLRNEGGRTLRLPFSYERATSADGADENFVVRAGDIIVVP